MGKFTEYITYLNVKDHPTALDIQHYYSHITIDAKMKATRIEYRLANGLDERGKEFKNKANEK